MFTFLGGHHIWRERIASELQDLFANYSPGCDLASTQADHKEHRQIPISTHSLADLRSTLALIPVEVWESQTPVLDSVIRETLRLAEPHTAMRQNLGPEVRIGGKLIPSGAFVMYPFSDVHLNAELYSDPWRFDPSRQESKMPFSFVGWGAGEQQL